jgi:hypothetical protein
MVHPSGRSMFFPPNSDQFNRPEMGREWSGLAQFTNACSISSFGVHANRAAVFVTPLAKPFLINSDFAFPLPIGCGQGS